MMMIMRRTCWFLLVSIVSQCSGAALRPCPAPGVDANTPANTALRLRFIGRQRFLSGAMVFYDCVEGFTPINGSHSVLCTDGQWGNLSLQCQKGRTSCSTPTVTNSVKPQISVHQPGDNLTITCHQGFQLFGKQRITCGADGQWKPLPPRCRRPPGGCGVPPTVPNSKAELDEEDLTKTAFSSGDKVYYQCPVGYAPTGGSSSRRCVDGEWTRLKMTCERRFCGSAGEILNGHFEYTGVQFGDTATAFCNEGHLLVGKATRRCMDGGWDGRVPECEEVVCNNPPVVKNAELKGPSYRPYTYRDAVRYHCRVGTVIGEKELWCTKNGTWSAPAPVCKEIICKPPNVPNAFWLLRPKPYQYSDTIWVECKKGYQRTGTGYLTCNRKAQWEPALPRCDRPWKKPHHSYRI